MSTIKIAWRNLGRSKRRTILAMLAIAVGQFALLLTNSVMNGYMDNIRLAITGPMIGHAQIHAEDFRDEMAIDLVIENSEMILDHVRSDPAVMNAAARIYCPVLVAPKQDAFGAMAVGIDLEVESQEYGLVSGLDKPLEPGNVLMGYRLARRSKAKIGDEIAVVGQGLDGSLANDLYIIQDIIKSPADMINQSGVVMSLDDAQKLLVLSDQSHEIVIRTKQSGQVTELVERLRVYDQLEDKEVLAWMDIVPQLTQIFEMADINGYIILTIVMIAAIAGIANTLMMSTFERMHEFGMLLALGSRPGRIVQMIILEAILIGILGVIVGTVLGYGFVGALSDSGIDMASWGGKGEMDDFAYQGLNLPLHIYPRLEAGDVIMGLIAVIAVSLIASTWPAWIASRLEPMEAMRK